MEKKNHGYENTGFDMLSSELLGIAKYLVIINMIKARTLNSTSKITIGFLLRRKLTNEITQGCTHFVQNTTHYLSELNFPKDEVHNAIQYNTH